MFCDVTTGDNPHHYFVCDVLCYQHDYRRFTRGLSQSNVLRQRFNDVSLYLKSKILFVVHDVFSEIVKSRPDIPKVTRETLLFTYLSDRATTRSPYVRGHLRYDVLQLPKMENHSFLHVRSLGEEEITSLYNRKHIPFDLVGIFQLDHLPRFFLRCHCFSSVSCA